MSETSEDGAAHVEEGLRVQRERYRQMTPSERWRAAHDLYWAARRLKTAWLRQQHPSWTESEVDAEVRRVFTYARD